MKVPHELSVGDVYYSPLLLVVMMSLIATWLTIAVLNKTRLSRLIAFPSITFIAIMLFYVVGIDHFFLQF